MSYENTPVPDASEYYPLNRPPIGQAFSKDDFPKNSSLPKLFQPLTIRGVTFKNRIWVSPMCQYSAEDGKMSTWHLVHLGGLAIRGVGSVMLEATAVVPEGRITPQCAGIWNDEQVPIMKQIVDFVHAQGTTIGIQLAHAGRKASTQAPWVHSSIVPNRPSLDTWVAPAEAGGWPDSVYGPSTIPFADDYPTPKELTLEQLDLLEDAYVAAVQRCKTIGFDFIEIHGAHGYLLHSFYSPLSNKRTDEYGGSLENRLRLPLRIARRLRQEWDKPLFFRLSATDWAEEGEKAADGSWLSWGIEQTKILAEKLVHLGIDLIDTSSGGNWVKQKITTKPGYQVPFAEAVKKHINSETTLTGAVGLITEPDQAEQILSSGAADVIFLARELLRRGDWPLVAAQQLGVAVKVANQYERSWLRLYKL